MPSTSTARSSQPRYRQVAQQLIRAIEQGDYAVGDMLPTERELCDHFEISRHTARTALANLERLGLVQRRQGAGTEVRSTVPMSRFNQAVSTINELLQYGADTFLELLSAKPITADERLAKWLQISVGQPCVHLRCLRYDQPGGALVCVSDIYIVDDGSARAARMLGTDTAIDELLEEIRLARLSRVEQQLSAVAIRTELARLLHVESGSPGLNILRRYFDLRDQLVLVAQSVHGDADFVYSMELHQDHPVT